VNNDVKELMKFFKISADIGNSNGRNSYCKGLSEDSFQTKDLKNK
jgi:hypothetical protein